MLFNIILIYVLVLTKLEARVQKGTCPQIKNTFPLSFPNKYEREILTIPFDEYKSENLFVLLDFKNLNARTLSKDGKLLQLCVWKLYSCELRQALQINDIIKKFEIIIHGFENKIK